VPEELRQYAEDITMRFGTLIGKNGYGEELAYNGLLIKHEGVTMLLTVAWDTPISGCFILNNGTQLQINCYKSNWLYLGYGVCIFGVSEHLDKIGNAGF
jgi:hypothetical protein